MNSSTSWSSSRMATIVSWSFEETIMSFVMHSVRKSPHPDVENETESGERRNDRRPAITHEWQRDGLYRRHARRHGGVLEHLKRKPGNQPRHEVRPVPALRQSRRLEGAQH